MGILYTLYDNIMHIFWQPFILQELNASDTLIGGATQDFEGPSVCLWEIHALLNTLFKAI